MYIVMVLIKSLILRNVVKFTVFKDVVIKMTSDNYYWLQKMYFI